MAPGTIRLRAFRALLRVEGREALRHRGRTFLLMLLVAVPVAAVVGASCIVRITTQTPEEKLAARMGVADLRIEAGNDYADRARVVALLPAGARAETVFLGADEVSSGGRTLRATLMAMNPRAAPPEGLASGMLRIIEGRAPENAGEVALSPALLTALDRKPGETVLLGYGRERTITGVVVDPEHLDSPLVLRTPAASEVQGKHVLLVAVHAANADSLAARIEAAGFSVDRRRAPAGGGEGAFLVFALGAIGFLEAALVIAAAFAVSLRRRQRDVGLLASVGASARAIQGSLVASAMGMALAGGIAGALMGSGVAAVLHPFLDQWNQRLNGPFSLSLLHTGIAVAMGVVTAMLAAAAPARGASRLPIRVALGGRRPVTTPPRRWLIAGLSMVGLSLALLLVIPRDQEIVAALSVIGGSVLGVLGFGACSPWLLDVLARGAGPLPLPWRLALRDSGRFRARNGPVVTAILAGMSMSVTVAVLIASVINAMDRLPMGYRDDQMVIDGPGAEEVATSLAAEPRVLAAAPLAAVYHHDEPVRVRLQGAHDSQRSSAWIACGDETLLRALGGESALEPFRQGRIVVLDPDLTREHGYEFSSWVSGSVLNGPAVAIARTGQRVREPRFVLNQASLKNLGFEPGLPLRRTLPPWVVRLTSRVTPEDLARAERMAKTSVGTSVDAALLLPRPARSFYLLLLTICIGTGLVIVIIAVALSAAESGQDVRVLHSVGATPGLVRTLLAARAGYLALLGCALAVPAGLIPAIALFDAASIPLQLILPIRDLAIIVLGLPLVAFAGTWLYGPEPRGGKAFVRSGT